MVQGHIINTLEKLRNGAKVPIMKEFFGYEGGFFRFMDKFGSIFILNLLCLACSIPIFTFGASITACYYVTLKMVRDEECYIIKEFFRSFRLNFKQATLIWLIFMVLGAVFFVDYRLLTMTAPDGTAVIPFGNMILVILFVVMIVGVMILTYIFPLLAKFDNTVRQMFLNAFMMSIRHLPKTLFLILLNVMFPATLGCVLWTGKGLWLVPVILCLGTAGAAYLCSMIFVGIFDLYMPKEEIREDTDAEKMVEWDQTPPEGVQEDNG